MQRLTSEAPAAVRPRNKWAGLGVLAAGLSMIVIDGTIVGVSLPTIIDDLHLDLNQAQWVNSLYSVVLAALLLTSGRIADSFGRRKLFIIGVVLFMAGSIFAALSASAVGPLLGGWLTASFAWQWIFIVNVPLALLVLAGTVLFVPETRSPQDSAGLDGVGLVLSFVGFGLFVFAVIEGPSLGWWNAAGTLDLGPIHWPADAALSAVPVSLAIAIAALVAFVLWERRRAARQQSAILNLSLFRIPTFSWGNAVAATVAIGEFGLLLVLPLYLINILGLGTLQAGLVLAAMAAGAFLSGASARHLAARLGPPTVVIVGLALETVGLLALGLVITAGTSIWLIAALLVVYGLGLGLASAQLTGMVLADIPTAVSGQGSATQSTVRQLGAALGSAIMGSVLAHFAVTSSTGLLAGIPGVPPLQVETLADQLRDSAGGVVPQLAQLGTHGPLGAAGPDAAAALSTGFAQALSVSVLTAAVFLFVGLVGSFFVAAAARKTARRQRLG